MVIETANRNNTKKHKQETNFEQIKVRCEHPSGMAKQQNPQKFPSPSRKLVGGKFASFTTIDILQEPSWETHWDGTTRERETEQQLKGKRKGRKSFRSEQDLQWKYLVLEEGKILSLCDPFNAPKSLLANWLNASTLLAPRKQKLSGCLLSLNEKRGKDEEDRENSEAAGTQHSKPWRQREGEEKQTSKYSI